MSPGYWPLEEHHRAILAREEGTLAKDPGGRLRVGLVYPNTYAVGAANLGLAVVYRLGNARPDLVVERAFLPDRKATALYAKTGLPLLTLESSRPLADCDLVLCSISFENDYPHLAAMLVAAGLGIWSAEREGPLVIAGGVAPMLNPEPLADIVDGFLLGEAEVVLEPFLQFFTERSDLDREDLLLELARGVRGFYAPRFYDLEYAADGTLAARRPREGLPALIPAPKYAGPPSGLAVSAIQAPGVEFGEMTLVEVGRGCGHGCRFCAAGHIYRPPRLGVAGDYLDTCRAVAAAGGKVGLVSAAVSDLEGLADLAGAVGRDGGSLGVSSLRADRVDPAVVARLVEGGLKTVALAPEAGSARLRRVINKHLGEDDLARAVEALVSGGVPNLRLYFMVGLPGETDDDVDELIGLVSRIREQVVSFSRPLGRLGQVTVSLNAFVPKPFTPFQWEAMAPIKEIKAAMARVEKRLKHLANLKVTTDVPKYAQLQAALARGDRRLGRLIAALAADPAPQRAWKAAGLDPEFHAHRQRERDELLPWSIVDHGVSIDYLWRERERALAAQESPDCKPATCRRCGACGPEEAP